MLDRDKERLGVSSCTHDGEVSQTQIFSEPTGPTRIETHATHPTAPYGRLPVELLMMVKDNIPISDLRTHVCFYQTCRTVAAFYGDEDEEEEFWMKSCRSAGLATINDDETYKEVAFDCIYRDGFCSHPACGEVLLRNNGDYFESDPWKIC